MRIRISQEKTWVCGRDGKSELFDPKTNKAHPLDAVRGRLARWSTDGRHIAFLIFAGHMEDRDAGLWVYDLAGVPRQVFRGWVGWYAWAGADELFVLKGKPDLNAVFWRDGEGLTAEPQFVAHGTPRISRRSKAAIGKVSPSTLMM